MRTTTRRPRLPRTLLAFALAAILLPFPATLLASGASDSSTDGTASPPSRLDARHPNDVFGLKLFDDEKGGSGKWVGFSSPPDDTVFLPRPSAFGPCEESWLFHRCGDATENTRRMVEEAPRNAARLRTWASTAWRDFLAKVKAMDVGEFRITKDGGYPFWDEPSFVSWVVRREINTWILRTDAWKTTSTIASSHASSHNPHAPHTAGSSGFKLSLWATSHMAALGGNTIEPEYHMQQSLAAAKLGLFDIALRASRNGIVAAVAENQSIASAPPFVALFNHVMTLELCGRHKEMWQLARVLAASVLDDRNNETGGNERWRVEEGRSVDVIDGASVSSVNGGGGARKDRYQSSSSDNHDSINNSSSSSSSSSGSDSSTTGRSATTRISYTMIRPRSEPIGFSPRLASPLVKPEKEKDKKDTADKLMSAELTAEELDAEVTAEAEVKTKVTAEAGVNVEVEAAMAAESQSLDVIWKRCVMHSSAGAFRFSDGNAGNGADNDGDNDADSENSDDGGRNETKTEHLATGGADTDRVRWEMGWGEERDKLTRTATSSRTHSSKHSKPQGAQVEGVLRRSEIVETRHFQDKDTVLVDIASPPGQRLVSLEGPEALLYYREMALSGDNHDAADNDNNNFNADDCELNGDCAKGHDDDRESGSPYYSRATQRNPINPRHPSYVVLPGSQGAVGLLFRFNYANDLGLTLDTFDEDSHPPPPSTSSASSTSTGSSSSAFSSASASAFFASEYTSAFSRTRSSKHFNTHEVSAPVVGLIRPYLGGNNLYHWLVESVPRLVLLSQMVPLAADPHRSRAATWGAKTRRGITSRMRHLKYLNLSPEDVKRGIPLVVPDSSLARQTLQLLFRGRRSDEEGNKDTDGNNDNKDTAGGRSGVGRGHTTPAVLYYDTTGISVRLRERWAFHRILEVDWSVTAPGGTGAAGHLNTMHHMFTPPLYGVIETRKALIHAMRVGQHSDDTDTQGQHQRRHGEDGIRGGSISTRVLLVPRIDAPVRTLERHEALLHALEKAGQGDDERGNGEYTYHGADDNGRSTVRRRWTVDVWSNGSSVPLRKQLAMFSRSHVVVATPGAALANMVVAGPCHHIVFIVMAPASTRGMYLHHLAASIGVTVWHVPEAITGGGGNCNHTATPAMIRYGERRNCSSCVARLWYEKMCALVNYVF